MAVSESALKLIRLVGSCPGISPLDACHTFGGNVAALAAAMCELPKELITEGADDITGTRLWLSADGFRVLAETHTE